MFKDCFKEGQNNKAIIDDVEPTIFKEMLRLAYGGESNFLNIPAQEILIAADKYRIGK